MPEANTGGAIPQPRPSTLTELKEFLKLEVSRLALHAEHAEQWSIRGDEFELGNAAFAAKNAATMVLTYLTAISERRDA